MTINTNYGLGGMPLPQQPADATIRPQPVVTTATPIKEAAARFDGSAHDPAARLHVRGSDRAAGLGRARTADYQALAKELVARYQRISQEQPARAAEFRAGLNHTADRLGLEGQLQQIEQSLAAHPERVEAFGRTLTSGAEALVGALA